MKETRHLTTKIHNLEIKKNPIRNYILLPYLKM